MTELFIDGSAGTTGLRIYERLEGRNDIHLIRLPEDRRKDPTARKEALNRADIAFLCLPDAAAKEAVSLCDNPDTVLIDTSTAHRTDSAWAYGFPELSEAAEEKIRNSRRIAVPGCHASGFIALIFPLMKAGLLSESARLSCFSLTGYSGGGKKMIAEYEAEERDPLFAAPRQYGLSQTHKHLPEMTSVTGLACPPCFCPVVADFYSGMEVTVPLFGEWLTGSMKVIKEVYQALYTGPVVRYTEEPFETGFASASKLAGTDSMEISVAGNDERILLIARYDNLGKGASGAAVECMNIKLGIEKTAGLQLWKGCV